jgi:hypothetical protein
VEVDQEGADGVLVGLADALPELMITLYNLVPVCLGRSGALATESVRKQRSDC